MHDAIALVRSEGGDAANDVLGPSLDDPLHGDIGGGLLVKNGHDVARLAPERVSRRRFGRRERFQREAVGNVGDGPSGVGDLIAKPVGEREILGSPGGGAGDRAVPDVLRRFGHGSPPGPVVRRT